MLHGMGIETGVDLEKVVEAGEYICDVLSRPSASKVSYVTKQNPLIISEAQTCVLFRLIFQDLFLDSYQSPSCQHIPPKIFITEENWLA
jgi:hypothetical protein